MEKKAFQLNWQTLERLRGKFLAADARGTPNYWQQSSDLSQYDEVFAPRIRWKWDAVLRDIADRDPGFFTGSCQLIDWGCGSGVASLAVLEQMHDLSAVSVHLVDQSALARQYAAQKIAAQFPTVKVHHGIPSEIKPEARLLVSHVLTEIDDATFGQLKSLSLRCHSLIWVEPGMPLASKRLVEARELWRDSSHQIVAPCTHQNTCGMRARHDAGDWCHFFAKPPNEVFRSAFWREVSETLKIDLRSLPVSYLVAQKPAPITSNIHDRDSATCARLIGRPKLGKNVLHGLTCNKTGINACAIRKRDQPALYKQLNKDLQFRQELAADG